MNELIRKLALQAGHRYIPSSNSGPLRVEYLAKSIIKKLAEVAGAPELEKFAELIVRECIKKIETYKIPFGYTGASIITYDALKEICDDIKEHFGVNND